MATALFIKRTDLVKNTIINGNVDTDKFIGFIKIAQEMHLQNYLGTDLYNKISTDIINDELTGDYLTLVNTYIQPMLIHYAMIDYLPFAAYEIKNGGLFKHRSENAETPSKEEVDFLVQRHRHFADFYTQRFLDHMSFNASSKYNEYYTNTNEDMHPDKSNNFVGWVL
jgi:hypothetical protein